MGVAQSLRDVVARFGSADDPYDDYYEYEDEDRANARRLGMTLAPTSTGLAPRNPRGTCGVRQARRRQIWLS
jgi:hypothetical protein